MVSRVSWKRVALSCKLRKFGWLGAFRHSSVNQWARDGKVDSSASEKAGLTEVERILPLGGVTGRKQVITVTYFVPLF